MAQSLGEPTIVLPGMPGEAFCIHPSGISAFILVSPIVRIDLTTGERTRMKTVWPKTFKVKNSIILPVAVIRAEKLFIYAFFIESGTNKTYFVSFAAEDNSISVIDEQYIGIDGAKSSKSHLQRIGKGQINYVTYSHTNSNTTFHAAKIEVHKSGKIASTFTKKSLILSGYWIAPFISGGCLFWLPMQSSFNSLLQFSLQNEDVNQICVTNEMTDNPDHFELYTKGQVNDDHIFYYAYEKRSNHGIIFKLDMREKSWQKFELQKKDHALIDVSMKFSENNSLYLHGNCSMKRCKEKAHIFVIDFRKEVKQNVMKYVTGGASSLATRVSSIATFLTGNFGRNISDSKENEDKRQSLKENKKWRPGNRIVKSDELGRGGFGIVYQCFDLDAQKYFVGKYLETNSAEEQKHIDAVMNEIKQLERMNHPRIIDYYGCIKGDRHTFIFMEYMAAGSLRKIIDKFGLLSEKVARKYIYQILEGLAYIHGLGIVHCDLKCDNVLQDGHGNVKLGDFGIAVRKSLTFTDHSFFSTGVKGGGCCYWVAPEIINSKGCKRQSDFWSLGCTIVEMLTGAPPYSTVKIPTFYANLIHQKLAYDVNDLLPDSSDKMKNFVGKLLQQEAKKRPRPGEESKRVYNEIFSTS